MSENENSLFISQRSAILPIPFVKKPQKLKTKIVTQKLFRLQSFIFLGGNSASRIRLFG